MKFLLDTHVIILFLQGDKLPRKVLDIMAEEKAYISAVNIWEITIKSQLNKLRLTLQ
jgi:PIN domain nuclease of toxin-antitoxin system